MTTLKFMIVPLLAFIFSSCGIQSPAGRKAEKPQLAALGDQLHFLLLPVDSASAQTDQPAKGDMPVSPRSLNGSGQLVLVPPKDWCSGFFAGCLWEMYELTGDKKWERPALHFTELLEDQKWNRTTHDMGFKMMPSFGKAYRFTENKNYRDILIQSAKTLITRYNDNVRCLRSWDHNQDKWQFPVIIDNMMNLELLFWASKETGDPVFYNIAVNHADMTMKNHFRGDYSSYHVVDYDTITGKVVKRNTHQGYADESAWSRGQAWALYGYTLCYRETGGQKYLEQARHIADFILTHPNLPDDLVPYWDFDAPSIPDEPRDASAAAVISSALFELSRYLPDSVKLRYRKPAEQILDNLTAYRSAPGKNKGFILDHSTGSRPHNSEVDVPIIYADYYYLEALIRRNSFSAAEKAPNSQMNLQ
ncbi:MAG: glycoside hydrolase family 88 protein [Mangrovibacterium sp.]